MRLAALGRQAAGSGAPVAAAAPRARGRGTGAEGRHSTVDVMLQCFSSSAVPGEASAGGRRDGSSGVRGPRTTQGRKRLEKLPSTMAAARRRGSPRNRYAVAKVRWPLLLRRMRPPRPEPR
ncbi:unnamed protein product [Pieris macdunnoughi]|uniref:Uncharacterized protein n=1 Tax=Pieris macdunnoughi TaxID=345717 RepID=A0A821TBH7_9NEOP|nr:unnamed protein product [Pieris macdunnoughi]